MKHRGRIQAQGKQIEASEAWSQNTPITKKEGLSMLDKLKNKLSKNALKLREKPFKKARRFINNGPYQVVDKKISKTYVAPDTKNERVDIEIQKGTAFTNEKS